MREVLLRPSSPAVQSPQDPQGDIGIDQENIAGKYYDAGLEMSSIADNALSIIRQGYGSIEGAVFNDRETYFGPGAETVHDLFQTLNMAARMLEKAIEEFNTETDRLHRMGADGKARS